MSQQIQKFISAESSTFATISGLYDRSFTTKEGKLVEYSRIEIFTLNEKGVPLASYHLGFDPSIRAELENAKENSLRVSLKTSFTAFPNGAKTDSSLKVIGIEPIK